MNSESLIKFQKRARYVASKRGYPQLADDFSQEVILAFLKDPDRRSTVDQLFIDYLRLTYGDTRSDYGRARAQAELHFHPLDDARNIGSNPEVERQDGGCAFLFRGREAELYQAYFLEERTLADIGDEWGCSESRICQLLKPMRHEIETQAIISEVWERYLDEPSFSKLQIEWIKL